VITPWMLILLLLMLPLCLLVAALARPTPPTDPDRRPGTAEAETIAFLEQQFERDQP
jgi:hypothetical protein